MAGILIDDEDRGFPSMLAVFCGLIGLVALVMLVLWFSCEPPPESDWTWRCTLHGPGVCDHRGYFEP